MKSTLLAELLYSVQQKMEFFNGEIIDENQYYENYINNDDKSFVVFGYASIITMPMFQYENRKPGCLKDVATRFYQGSQSHGTENWLGRVATIIPSPGTKCFGEAFYVHDKEWKMEAWKHLMAREKNYILMAFDFYPLSEGNKEILNDVERVLCFVALPDNIQYIGECDIVLQAYQIWKASSKWPNTFYLNSLIGFLRTIPSHLQNDNYVESLGSIIEQISRNEIILTPDQLKELPKKYVNEC